MPQEWENSSVMSVTREKPKRDGSRAEKNTNRKRERRGEGRTGFKTGQHQAKQH